jgi:hypothetical protein
MLMVRRPQILLLVLWSLVSGDGAGRAEQPEHAKAPLPLILLVDVYDTTFLVGSKNRCSPSCIRDADGSGQHTEECTQDLNNDDVTRFGLGQRVDFGVVRDAGCPFPHLSAGALPRAEANRIAAVIQTDFSLDAVFGTLGAQLLDASDFVSAGEALDYSNTVRAAWIVEPRHMFPPTYEHAVRVRGEYDVIFTHVRELVAQYPETFRFCPFGTTYLRRWDHQMYPKTKLLSIIASRKGSDPNGGGMQGHRMRHEAIRRLGHGYHPTPTNLWIMPSGLVRLPTSRVRPCALMLQPVCVLTASLHRCVLV